MRTNKLPGWLVFLLVLVALVVLGPPALAVLAVALGVTIALGGVLLKVGLAVLAVYAVVALLRAVFGRPDAAPALPKGPPTLESLGARLEHDEQERRAALDRELDAALRHTT